MRNPRDYIDEIRTNVEKMRAQGQVTPTENALFGMIDGLGGLMLVTLERVTALEQQLGIQSAARTRETGDESAGQRVPPA